MAMNVTPFVGTDNFNMETFNNMISQINSGVNSEISDVLAQLGTKAEIVYSSYVGTGTHGSANPSTLAFASKPLFVVIRAAKGDTGNGVDQKMILVYGSTWCKSQETYSSSYNFVTWSGNSVSWYCTNSDFGSHSQMNELKTVYRYVAFLAADE